jgi:hypothetical protein
VKINLLTICLLFTLASCTPSTNSLAGNLPTTHSRKPTPMQSTLPAVEITFVNKRYQRPPLVSLSFNVTLRNQAAEPRWFILPSKLNLPPGKGVDGVEIYQINGQGRVVIGRFQGTSGVQTLLLPANAQVTLWDLSIAYWGSLPKDEIALEVITAKQLTVGNEPIQAWFGNNPSSDAAAEVSIAQQEKLSSRFTSDRREVPLAIVEEQRIKIKVGLTEK